MSDVPNKQHRRSFSIFLNKIFGTQQSSIPLQCVLYICVSVKVEKCACLCAYFLPVVFYTFYAYCLHLITTNIFCYFASTNIRIKSQQKIQNLWKTPQEKSKQIICGLLPPPCCTRTLPRILIPTQLEVFGKFFVRISFYKRLQNVLFAGY